MKYASFFLQWLYGGKNLEIPDWQIIANQHLQTMNNGYHPGRFINCIEITMHAYKALLSNKGIFFPNVTPLPTIPPRIPGYISQVDSRMVLLDGSKRAHYSRMYNQNYAQLLEYIETNNFSVYSHLIILAQLKKIPGGHALSGIVVPNESNEGIRVYLYDAQGFLPEAWLYPEQFDEFYSIESVYVYDSEDSKTAVKAFIDRCKTEASSIDDKPEQTSVIASQTISEIEVIKAKLIEFIKLELFRLEAKLIVSPHNDTTYLQDKIDKYKKILVELIDNKSDDEPHLSIAKIFVRTAKTVKNHCYSYNWFDPQSLIHFRHYFEKFISHKKFQEKPSINAITDYIAIYLIYEIIRLSLINEYTNSYIDGKVELLIDQLRDLFSEKNDTNHLKNCLIEIQKISSMTRHWFGFYTAATSSNLFDMYLKSVLEDLNEILIEFKGLENDWVELEDGLSNLENISLNGGVGE